MHHQLHVHPQRQGRVLLWNHGLNSKGPRLGMWCKQHFHQLHPYKSSCIVTRVCPLKGQQASAWKHSIMVHDCFSSIIYSTFQPESFIGSYHKAIHGSAIYFPGGISWKCITTLPDALQPSPIHHRPFEWPDNRVAMSIREESGGLRGRAKNMGRSRDKRRLCYHVIDPWSFNCHISWMDFRGTVNWQ